MEEGVALSVRDSGPGIDPELLPRIFERFGRGSASGDDHGTGLGLAIAKSLVEAQGGILTIGSQPGEGSIFSVILPQAEIPGSARPTHR